MLAGVDCGLSLVKAAMRKGTKENQEYTFFSSADCGLEGLAKKLADEGVRRIHVAGAGYTEMRANYQEWFQGFSVTQESGESIPNELRLQVAGARILLERVGYQKENFLVVSIGTGTSYTLVNGDILTPFPLGNSHGGGSIKGKGIIFGAKDYSELADLANSAEPLDLCIADVFPEKRGTFEGSLVVANFGKATRDSDPTRLYASAVSEVAIEVARDIYILKMIPEFQNFADVIFVGSTIARTPLLKRLIQGYEPVVQKKFLFPDNGEFALAIGAYHAGVNRQ